MKTLIITILLLASSNLFAQEPVIEYEYRMHDTRSNMCGGCPTKPGERVPNTLPYAHFTNDTTLWEWKEVDVFGVGELHRIYDLKPQYKDTIITNSGSVVEVPIWIKNPEWVKPENDL